MYGCRRVSACVSRSWECCHITARLAATTTSSTAQRIGGKTETTTPGRTKTKPQQRENNNNNNNNNNNKNKHHVSSKLQKREEKLLRAKLLRSDNGKTESHVYKNLYPWKDPKQLAHHLKATQVFNADGLIALNKPYGIGLEKVTGGGGGGGRRSQPHTVVQTLTSGGCPAHTPALKEVLPHLMELYNVQHLEVVKSTERWSSGVVVLSSSREVTEKVQKCLRRSRAEGRPAMAYRAVTVGLPVPVQVTTRVGTQLQYVNNVGHMPVIVKTFSKTSIEEQQVKPVMVEHRALAYSNESGATLVELKSQVSRWHFLRVWLAHSYSPALGDHLYSGRVKTLLSRRVQVSPHNVSYDHQVLPATLSSLLSLPPRCSEFVPCHIHLSEVTLRQYHKDKTDLVLSAPPPPHFTWTCGKLGLLVGENEEEKDIDEEEEETVNETVGHVS